jgi:hypothetical protein
LDAQDANFQAAGGKVLEDFHSWVQVRALSVADT